MSDEMKNCCPPETTAPKMEVHDAAEGSKDIKPKVVSTAHKQLSKDEFQRKVAAAAARVSQREMRGYTLPHYTAETPVVAHDFGARVAGLEKLAGPPEMLKANPAATQQMDQRYMRNRGLAGQAAGGLMNAFAGPVAGGVANVATRAGLNRAAGDVALKGIVPGAGTGSGLAGPGGEKALMQRALGAFRPAGQ